MTRPIAPSTWWIGHVLLAMLVTGCAKKADMGASPSVDHGGAEEDLGLLEQRLAAREDQLRSAGFAVPGDAAVRTKKAASSDAAPASAPEPSPITSAGADADANAPQATAERVEQQGGRCMQVCEISTAICSLQDQICGLVPRHRGEPRYQDACDRATADCQLSTEACHGCSDT